MRLSALLLSLVVLAGCESASGKTELRLRYWGDLDEIRITEDLCRDFEKTHPGVVIKPERKSSDVYSDILLQEFAAGRAPDVLFLGPDNMDPLAANGLLEPLDPLMKESGLKKSDWYPAMVQRMTYQGRLLVLPRDVAPIAVIYYNKKLFDEAKLPYPKDSWHWEDLRRDAKALTKRDKDGIAVQYGFADEWNIYEAWILSAGGRLVDDEADPHRILVGTGGAVDGLRMRWELLQKDRVMPSSTENKTLSGGNQALFLNGQLAMFHTGIWKTPGFRKITAFDWDVVRFPTKKGAKDPHFALAGSGYALRKGLDPAKKKLAWELAVSLAGPEGERRMAETGLVQPALRAMARSKAFLDGKKPLNKGMLLDAAEHGRCNPAWVPWAEFIKTIWGPQTDPLWQDGFHGDLPAVLKAAENQGNQKFFGHP